MFLVCVSCRRGKTTKQQNESCEYTDRKRMFHCVCIMKKLYTVILKHGGGGGEYLCGGGNGGLSTVYMGVRVETIYVWVGMGDCLHRGEGGRLSTWGWGLSMWGWEWGTLYMGVRVGGCLHGGGGGDYLLEGASGGLSTWGWGSYGYVLLILYLVLISWGEVFSSFHVFS